MVFVKGEALLLNCFGLHTIQTHGDLEFSVHIPRSQGFMLNILAAFPRRKDRTCDA